MESIRLRSWETVVHRSNIIHIYRIASDYQHDDMIQDPQSELSILIGGSPDGALVTPSSPVECDWHFPFFGITHIDTADEIVASVHMGNVLEYSQMDDPRRDQRVGLMARP
jgi:hypothetical protein